MQKRRLSSDKPRRGNGATTRLTRHRQDSNRSIAPGARTLDRIRFIKQAQLHGLTLREIRELLGFQDRRGRERCRQVQNLLTRKLGDVDLRLQQLQDFRHTLRDYLSQCERALGRATDEDCPVVRDLSDEPLPKRR